MKLSDDTKVLMVVILLVVGVIGIFTPVALNFRARRRRSCPRLRRRIDERRSGEGRDLSVSNQGTLCLVPDGRSWCYPLTQVKRWYRVE